MIVAAAIRIDGVVHTGRRHDIIIHRRYRETGKRVIGEQGFVTDIGTFVSRVEALRIARAAGQQINKHGHPGELFSEDIYDDPNYTKDMT